MRSDDRARAEPLDGPVAGGDARLVLLAHEGARQRAGERVQDGSTKTMIFNVPKLVSYTSHFMTLHPGDIISTGTPPGVGMGKKPEPVFLKGGETMRLGIEGLGEQTQQVVAP